MQEQFKTIKGYEGLYDVSNFGRVKSLARKWIKKTFFLKLCLDTGGYLFANLSKNGKHEKPKIHTLVYDHFGKGKRNGRILTVDHWDNDKLNNRIDNLQLLTHRKNCIKRSKQKHNSSQYSGVTQNNHANSWMARIYINGKHKYLGSYKNEYKAHLVYQKALLELNR